MDAEDAARRAAGQAGVSVRPLAELAELRAVCELFQRIWQRSDVPLMTVELLRALTHAGNYAAGAYEAGTLVGASVGFLAAPPGAAMHSHVTGVVAAARGRGIGFALKLHQRTWALARGLTEVTWTFDPLVRRNAYFNLTRLAARPREYLVDFYGELADAVNAGQGSDRLLVVWDLTAREVVAACAGRPRVAGGATRHLLSVAASGEPRRDPVRGRAELVSVDVPGEVEALRQRDPELALRWRLAVREVLGGLMAGGATVTGFAETEGYLVRW